jgi:hypothetical protein
MAREPQQNPVLVFSITLTQKRVRPPVWIILVLHAELSSVRALLVKGLYHSNLPSTLACVRCAFPVACTHTNKNQKMPKQILTNTGPSTKLFAWGGGDIGGHVLRETTSRGLCGLVCPSRISERGGRCVFKKKIDFNRRDSRAIKHRL